MRVSWPTLARREYFEPSQTADAIVDAARRQPDMRTRQVQHEKDLGNTQKAWNAEIPPECAKPSARVCALPNVR